MVMTLDGLLICECCGLEFPLRKMDGDHCRPCARETGADDYGDD